MQQMSFYSTSKITCSPLSRSLRSNKREIDYAKSSAYRFSKTSVVSTREVRKSSYMKLASLLMQLVRVQLTNFASNSVVSSYRLMKSHLPLESQIPLLKIQRGDLRGSREFWRKLSQAPMPLSTSFLTSGRCLSCWLKSFVGSPKFILTKFFPNQPPPLAWNKSSKVCSRQLNLRMNCIVATRLSMRMAKRSRLVKESK